MKKKEKNNDEKSKKTNKTPRGGGEKLKNKMKKTQMLGKEEENKKRGFHKMPMEFVCPNSIHSALSNANRNGFGHHQIQLPLDSIATIRWQTKWIQLLPSNGNQKHFGHH